MADSKRSRGFRYLLAGVPLLLIGAGAAIFWWRGDGASTALGYGETYEIWVSEAEVTPVKPDGGSWDSDGSAPDLQAVIVWQNQPIFETVTDSDGLIAQWQPVGLKLTEVLRGEADTATVRRVGRVRPDENGFIEVGVFDNDPVGLDQVGVFRLPWRLLKPGVNEIRDPGPLLRLRLVILEPGAEGAAMPVQIVKGAEKLPALSVASGSIVEGVIDEAGKRVDSVKKDTVEKTGQAVDRVKSWFKRDPDKE
jgi:hypothetical protein